jgi:DNA polymerase-3 subunit epsilon
MPDRKSILIHGLRSRDLIGAPTLAEALGGLLESLAGRVMVAHFAAIEEAFIGAAFRGSGIRLVNPIVDTAALGAELFRLRGRGPPGPFGLAQLAQALGLPVHRPHEADGDALTTAQVFLALAAHLDGFSPQTVGSMERLSCRPSGRVQRREALRQIGQRLAGFIAGR